MSADSLRYDQVSYSTGAFDITHPRRLATLAALYGLDAPVSLGFRGVRILELGCNSGGNLLPMAVALPEATLVGVDLAQGEIAVAQATAAHLGLRNITFHCQDILTLTRELGTFDYILAHGVYSWVPAAVQERVLWVCGNLLSEKGVAYVSYNTLPGGRVRQLLRDMTKYHVRHLTDPQEQVAQAHAFASALVESVPPQDALYRTLLAAERDRLARVAMPVVFHDDLAEPNESILLHDFVARAARHGLRYLADSDFSSMHAHRFPRAAAQLLAPHTDRVEHEQYLDFLSCRTFRRTLLCRADIELASEPLVDKAQQMWTVSYATPQVPVPSLFSDEPMRFRNRSGVIVGLGDVLAKVALSCLIDASPQALGFAELLSAVTERMRAGGVAVPDPAQLRAALSELLVTLYSGDMVELYLEIPATAAVPGERPHASPIARWQARESARVTSLWHRNLLIDDALALRLLPLVDGTRTHGELLAAVLRLPPPSLAGDPAAVAPPPDEAAIAATLAKLARLGLLLP